MTAKKRWWLLLSVVLLLPTGCCSWCDRWCPCNQGRGGSGYQNPGCCVPICQPACSAPAAASCPPGCAPVGGGQPLAPVPAVPQTFQRSFSGQPGCCN